MKGRRLPRGRAGSRDRAFQMRELVRSGAAFGASLPPLGRRLIIAIGCGIGLALRLAFRGLERCNVGR